MRYLVYVALPCALCCASCNTNVPPTVPASTVPVHLNEIVIDSDATLDNTIGIPCTITGKCDNAFAGAIVEINGVSNPIYIDGLHEWCTERLGTNITLSGIITQVTHKRPANTAGISGTQYIMNNPNWKIKGGDVVQQ